MLKKAIASLAALLMTVSLVAAQSLTLLGVGAFGGLQPNGITYQGQNTCTYSGGNCTVASANLGPAQANRSIFVEYADTAGCGGTFSITINGVTATQKAGGNFTPAAWIYAASVPTGATGNIVVNCTGSSTPVGSVSWFTVYGLASLTADNVQSNCSSPCSITNVNGGYVFLIDMYGSNGSSTLTGTGFVNDFNLDVSTGHATGGHGLATGAAMSISHSRTATDIMVGASFH